MLSPVLPSIVLHFGASTKVMGAIMSSFAVAMCVATQPSQHNHDDWPDKSTVSGAVVTFACCWRWTCSGHSASVHHAFPALSQATRPEPQVNSHAVPTLPLVNKLHGSFRRPQQADAAHVHRGYLSRFVAGGQLHGHTRTAPQQPLHDA